MTLEQVIERLKELGFDGGGENELWFNSTDGSMARFWQIALDRYKLAIYEPKSVESAP